MTALEKLLHNLSPVTISEVDKGTSSSFLAVAGVNVKAVCLMAAPCQDRECVELSFPQSLRWIDGTSGCAAALIKTHSCVPRTQNSNNQLSSPEPPPFTSCLLPPSSNPNGRVTTMESCSSLRRLFSPVCSARPVLRLDSLGVGTKTDFVLILW